MDKKKGLKFNISDEDHAKLRIKLQYECMSQTMFFNAFLKGYLEEHPLIKKYLDEYAVSNLDGKANKKRLKDNKETEKTVQEYGLDKEEIENIFDILESENGDI